jgi:hypothetical protein
MVAVISDIRLQTEIEKALDLEGTGSTKGN